MNTSKDSPPSDDKSAISSHTSISLPSNVSTSYNPSDMFHFKSKQPETSSTAHTDQPPPPPSTSPPQNSPPSVSPPPPALFGLPVGRPVYPYLPILSAPPASKTRDSPTPPQSSPPRAPESPTPPLLSPPIPSGTPLVPPQAPPTVYRSNSAPGNSNSDRGGIRTEGTEAIGLTVSFVLLVAIGITIWFVILRKRKRSRHSSSIMPTSLFPSHTSDGESLKMQYPPANAQYDYSAQGTGGLGSSRALYTYEELTKATNEFSEKNLLGEGGFGSVYRGCLPDGREVAVKQLKEGSGQGEREFRAEVETISHIHHKHLVSLVGYCVSDVKRLLVYDYVPNNTLHFHLHANGDSVLDWPARLKIALGAARGLAYLHEDCHPRIIHRDIKSSNILVDNNFEAQVSDFGLARLFSDTDTHVTTRVMGTFGYMAPEYALSGKLTDKSDVFSFGVVLLELITGRKPVDSSRPSGEESLVEWARPLLNDAVESEKFEALVDPRLENSYVDSEMFRIIEAAASCVRNIAAKRPRMIQVLRSFDSLIMASDLANGMRVGESKRLDATQQSGEIRLLHAMAFGDQNFSSGFYTQGSCKTTEEC